jgi:hypothetical protein
MNRGGRPLASAVGVALCLAVVASGCDGLGSDQEVPGRVTGRVVFEWWREIQFDNATVAAKYYSRDLGITPDKLDRSLTLGPGALGLLRRPRLVDVEIHGDTATVLVLLETASRSANNRVDRTRTARGFNLVREDGEWKLSENRYIERAARVQRFFAAEARRQAEAAAKAQGNSKQGGAAQDNPAP